MTPALVFDLDGTLVDSLPGIATALNAALAERGQAVHRLGKVRTFVGSGAFLLCRRAIPPAAPDELAHAVLRSFKRHYASHWQEGTTIYPGISSFIRRLTNAGTRLAVLSNKPDAFTRAMVDHLFPDHPFDIIRGQIDGTPRKPDPAALAPILDRWGLLPSEIRLIGDSEVDRTTADTAGVPFIGVAWGYQPVEALGPRVASSVSELEAVLTTG